MSKAKILVVGSNAVKIELKDGGFAPIGQYLNETVVPSMALIEAGYEIVLATPDGSKPHIDQSSDSVKHFANDEVAYARGKSFFSNDPSMDRPRTLQSIVQDGLDDYAGVFVPGGHAPVVDLMQNIDFGVVLRHFHGAGKPTAMLCHGPVAAAAAMECASEFRAAVISGDATVAGEIARGWPYAGYRMTVFSIGEEQWAEKNLFHAKLPFYMPDALRLAGADVTNGPVDMEPYVVVDRELITGQNMSSDHLIAAKMIEMLGGSLAKA